MAEAPRGRAALLQKLREMKSAQVGVTPQTAPSTSEVAPPRPTGRAALLKKLEESRLKKVGVEPVVSTTIPSPIEVTTGTATGHGDRNVPVITTSIQKLTLGEVKEKEKEKVTFRGEAGKPLRLTCNYVRLSVKENRGVFEYEVRFNPDVDSKSVRIKMVNSHMVEMGKTKMFDGGACLYLPHILPDKITEFPCSLPSGEAVTMQIIYKRQRSMGECLHFYNVLFKRIMRVLQYSRMARSYFNLKEKHMIPQHKLEVYPGFVVTVDELEDGLLLCLDATHRVLRSQNVLDLMEQLHGAPNFVELVRNEVIGACVLTRYNNKTYIVDDISWDSSPKDQFQTMDGSYISFIDYYKNQYGIEVRDKTQPLLINRKSSKDNEGKVDKMICLIPELCYLTGLTDAMRADFKVMKDVAAYTRITPAQRMNCLRTYLRNVANSPEAQEILSSWGLQLEDHTLRLQGRILDNESILFGQGKEFRTRNNADWTKPATDYHATLPIDMTKWIVFYTSRDSKHASKFVDGILRIGPSIGQKISQPKMFIVKDDRNESYIQAIENELGDDVQCAVFVCPTQRTDRYTVIKKLCYTKKGVASQVIMSKTLANELRSRAVIQKIALQINCKLGGSLWTLRFPFKKWMIVGIDVYHAGKGSRDDSVIAMVSSMNESITKWYSLALPQKGEISEYYKVLLTKSLENYRKVNGFYPEKIVVFRDGVGDGQLDYVKRFEIEQFEETIKEFNMNILLCFVVVQKRIGTKMFWDNNSELMNPEPGTVLDHSVTRKHYPDFFLVPQNVRQGTVNPIHYIVLHDKCNLKPDHIQRLSFKLCHLYYNWTGTIRVPAPCMYAHKCASIYGQHLKKPVSTDLVNTLYYL